MTLHKARAALEGAERIHDAAAVEQALARMAAEITADLSESLPLVLCAMIGGLVPTGRLLPMLGFPLELDYVHATRYRGATTGSGLVWQARPHAELADRTILLVDDILDEGYTLEALQGFCREQGARAVHTAVLVCKEHDRRAPGVHADYVGLTVDDRYVFGVGMDYHGVLRNVDGIYAVNPEESE